MIYLWKILTYSLLNVGHDTTCTPSCKKVLMNSFSKNKQKYDFSIKKYMAYREKPNDCGVVGWKDHI